MNPQETSMTIPPGAVLAVVGSRTWTDRERVFAVLDRLRPGRVVSGGALGADTLAREWAASRSVPLVEFPPDFRAHGIAAPHIRNRAILAESRALVAFHDGVSRGTARMIEGARRLGLPVEVVLPVAEEAIPHAER